MSSTRDTPIVLATAIGISFSATFVGGLFTLSLIDMPTLLLSSPAAASSKSPAKPATPSPHIARQWRSIFNLGKVAGPCFAISSAASWLYAAYQLSPSTRTQQALYVAAAVSVLGIVPYTLLVMKPTNDTLLARAADGDAMGDQMREGDVTEVGMPKAGGLQGLRTEDLIKRWANLNMGRGSLPFLAIGFALTALLW